jgi:hypothetical protein
VASHQQWPLYQAVATCRVDRDLTYQEIQRFHVPTPLKFDFSKRQCRPVLENQ